MIQNVEERMKGNDFYGDNDEDNYSEMKSWSNRGGGDGGQ